MLCCLQVIAAAHSLVKAGEEDEDEKDKDEEAQSSAAAGGAAMVRALSLR